MKVIIVCGAGQVGLQIARHLSVVENNHVTIVDNDAALVNQATDALDVGGVVGHASYPDVLKRAGADKADMIIAATQSDEVNIVTCQMAHSVFNIKSKIARLRAQSYQGVMSTPDFYRSDHFPIDVVISPEKEVASAALRQLAAPSTFDNEPFFDGQIEMLGITLEEDCAVVDTPLHQLSELFPTLRALVCAIRREDRLFIANRDDQLFCGDQVYLFTHRDDVGRTLEIFGKATKKRERVIIIGGGNVGLSVASQLENRTDRLRVKVIERSRACAENAAERLERTIVLHGDGLDMELLKEANLDKADALLAVTDDDKTNLLAATRAKAAGCPQVVALVNDHSLVPLMKPLKIDAFIHPRATTVSSILRYVRPGKVSQVYSIGDAEAEIIEAKVTSTSPIAGSIIRDIDVPDGAMFASIQAGDEVVRPTGDTRINEGDSVVIFSLVRSIVEVESLLHAQSSGL